LLNRLSHLRLKQLDDLGGEIQLNHHVLL